MINLIHKCRKVTDFSFKGLVLRSVLVPVLLLTSADLFAQANTNIFPPDGNVGIGTTSPENMDAWGKVLEIKGSNGSAKALVSSDKVVSGLWSHNLGYYGAPAGGITGTSTNHPFSFMTNKQTRMTISPDGSTGIGTTAPADLLEVDAGNDRRGITLTSQGNASAYSDIQFRVKNSSTVPVGKPAIWVISHRKDGYFSNNDVTGPSLEFYAVKVGGGYLAPLSFKANGDVVLASGRDATSGNVGIGTTSPKEKLSVNGNIRAKEIKVETDNWPDYVFKTDYDLLSLTDLEKYISIHKHLPGMPSAAEVALNGQNLGEVNSKLLKSVEELTLHLIEKDKQLLKQEAKLGIQQAELEMQDEKIRRLEKIVVEVLEKIK